VNKIKKAEFIRICKANPLNPVLKPAKQTKAQLEDQSYGCLKCRKTGGQLAQEGKIRVVQGYEQCVDCGGDLQDLRPPRKVSLKKADAFGKFLWNSAKSGPDVI